MLPSGMAGGSLPNIPVRPADKLQNDFLKEVCLMTPVEGQDCIAIGREGKGYLVYPQGGTPAITVADGKYQVYAIDMKHGDIRLLKKAMRLQGSLPTQDCPEGQLLWLRTL